jgi:ribosomal protein S18 acetylase RimI-like enzyme
MFENLNKEILLEIKNLETKRSDEDGINLKLELDYKLVGRSTEAGQKNEFLYYQNNELVGCIGICDFGSNEMEVTGMLHPSHRRQGIFTILSTAVMKEWLRRDADRLLLLTDEVSASGQRFIESIGAKFDSAEYEMHLKRPNVKKVTKSADIQLVRATNDDATELARQDRIYSGDDREGTEELSVKLPEEEKRGMTLYLAYKGNTVIGKVNLAIEGTLGSIYGLGVLLEYRRKGFGRQILLDSINNFVSKQCDDIMLQVVTENSNALNLYLDAGFKKTSTMNYYLMQK